MQVCALQGQGGRGSRKAFLTTLSRAFNRRLSGTGRQGAGIALSSYTLQVQMAVFHPDFRFNGSAVPSTPGFCACNKILRAMSRRRTKQQCPALRMPRTLQILLAELHILLFICFERRTAQPRRSGLRPQALKEVSIALAKSHMACDGQVHTSNCECHPPEPS